MILFHEVSVERGESVAEGFYKFKTRFFCKSRFAFEVVKKYASDTARFVSMLKKKIVVSPVLKLRVVGGMMLIANRFYGPMKMACIVRVDVVRRIF